MDDIEEVARSTLLALGLYRLPVDPEAIAREEGIELAPGGYSDTFDARIEYVDPPGTFILYYRTAEHGPTPGRVRFSQAHELGHFYLPAHRLYLLRGHTHNSVTDFRSRDPREAEADEFASALLMPRDLFFDAMGRRGQTVCSLADLCRLADQTFQTSVTSTVRRYCAFDCEPCGMVMSEAGRVVWALFSLGMRPLGLSYIPVGSPVPAPSRAAEVGSRHSKHGPAGVAEGRVDAGVWFDSPRCGWLWEESMPLGRTGRVLTFLVPDEAGGGDRDDD